MRRFFGEEAEGGDDNFDVVLLEKLLDARCVVVVGGEDFDVYIWEGGGLE